MFTWEQINDQIDHNEVNHNRVPREKLIFQPYNLGDWAFLRRVPMRSYASPTEEIRKMLSSKLQMRWTGPYRIIQVFSDVLYVCLVHGEERVTHAVNMKLSSAQTQDYAAGHLAGRINLEKLNRKPEPIKWSDIDVIDAAPQVAHMTDYQESPPIRDHTVLEAIRTSLPFKEQQKKSRRQLRTIVADGSQQSNWSKLWVNALQTQIYLEGRQYC